MDCAVCFGFGDANAVTFGFLAGLVGQVIAILVLIFAGSPVIIICGFMPVFLDNATMGLVANDKGGLKACLIIPFFAGLIEVARSSSPAGAAWPPAVDTWACSTGIPSGLCSHS